MVKPNIQLDLKQFKKSYPSILGCWDKSLPDNVFGTLLIFLAESQLVAQTSNTKSIDIAIDAASHNIKNILEGEFRLLDIKDRIDSYLNALNGFKIIKNIYVCGGRSGFKALSISLKNTHLTWGLNERTYDSTLYIQELYKLTGKLQPLEFKRDLQQWARKLIQGECDKTPVVGLHLKQSINWKGPPISLANNSVWYKFLSSAASRYKIKFLVLGDDPLDINIKKLPNIIVANEIGAETFIQNLALLSECVGFMGMMSSICNYALFSNIPYIIFKNPQHHKEMMEKELRGENYYSFATEFQKVYLINETVDLLLSEFTDMPFINDKG